MSYSIGCKKLKIGAIGALGVMGTTLTEYNPYKNTVVLAEADPTKTPHFSENKRYPDVVVAEGGSTDLNFEIHNLSKANLAKFLGGTADAVAETWSAADDHFSMEQSVEMDTIFGETWQIAACFLTGSLTWNANRTEVMRIKVSGMILNPTGENTPPLKKIATPA